MWLVVSGKEIERCLRSRSKCPVLPSRSCLLPSSKGSAGAVQAKDRQTKEHLMKTEPWPQASLSLSQGARPELRSKSQGLPLARPGRLNRKRVGEHGSLLYPLSLYFSLSLPGARKGEAGQRRDWVRKGWGGGSWLLILPKASRRACLSNPPPALPGIVHF